MTFKAMVESEYNESFEAYMGHPEYSTGDESGVDLANPLGDAQYAALVAFEAARMNAADAELAPCGWDHV